MREPEVDITGRRRFLKAAVAASPCLAVAPHLAGGKSGADAPAKKPLPAENSVTLEAPVSWKVSPIDVKPLEFPSDNPLPGLPGNAPLTWTGDLSVRMMDGAHRYAERKISESVEVRQKHWKRDLSSPAAYEKSVE